TLDQGAVSIEQQLCVIERAAIALVDADRDHHVGSLAGFANGQSRVRRHGHRLPQQPEVFRAHLERSLHEGEIGIVGHDRLREGGEPHALTAQSGDLLDDLFHGAFPAIKHGTDLHGGGLDDGHCDVLSWLAHASCPAPQALTHFASMSPRVAWATSTSPHGSECLRLVDRALSRWSSPFWPNRRGHSVTCQIARNDRYPSTANAALGFASKLTEHVASVFRANICICRVRTVSPTLVPVRPERQSQQSFGRGSGRTLTRPPVGRRARRRYRCASRAGGR